MTTFAERLSAAQLHESRVMDALRERGWHADGFGQGQLTSVMRNELRKVQVHVRWLADIIAAKSYPARTLIVFIDAKAGDTYKKTGNHDVELNALHAAERFTDFNEDKCPYYFVFDDMGVATPGMVRELGTPGNFRGSGSGTPFVLFPVSACRPFDSIFGVAA